MQPTLTVVANRVPAAIVLSHVLVIVKPRIDCHLWWSDRHFGGSLHHLCVHVLAVLFIALI